MDKEKYERWWPLHIKSARQEALTPDELAFYESGLKELDAEEVIHIDYEKLRRLRDTVKESEAELEVLVQRRKQLQARIVAMEAALPQRTKTLLGIQDS